MKITEEVIPLIENALGIKLFPWQKDYLVNDTPFPIICPCLITEFEYIERLRASCNAHYDGKHCYYVGRHTGKTTAHCIKLALADGEDRRIYDRSGFLIKLIHANDPIKIKEIEYYSDYGDGSLRYARGFYRKMFLDIWHKLKAIGLPVRGLIY